MRKAALAHRNIASRLIAQTLRHISKVKSPKLVLGTLPPALLNSVSNRPKVAFTLANSASTCSRVGDVGRNHKRLAGRGHAGGFFQRVLAASGQRDGPAAFQQVQRGARPIPLPAPVTMATFDLS